MLGKNSYQLSSVPSQTLLLISIFIQLIIDLLCNPEVAIQVRINQGFGNYWPHKHLHTSGGVAYILGLWAIEQAAKYRSVQEMKSL